MRAWEFIMHRHTGTGPAPKTDGLGFRPGADPRSPPGAPDAGGRPAAGGDAAWRTTEAGTRRRQP